MNCYLDFVGRMETHQNKVINEFSPLQGKKEQNEGNANKKHNHLALTVLARLFSAMFPICQHLL